jgi:hypothetical protein
LRGEEAASMTGARWKAIMASLASRSGTVIALAFAFPTVFVLSNNWYAASAAKILWLIGAMALAAFVAWALHRAVAAAAGRLLDDRGGSFAGAATWVSAIVLAVIVAGTLLTLLAGTLGLRGGRFAAAWLVGAGLLSWPFARGMLAPVSGALALLVSVALVSWVASAASVVGLFTGGGTLAQREAFEDAKFDKKPNIYLFIYDAYGNQDVYAKNFGFDNSQQYQELAARGFRVLHTFSNYSATWPTTLSLFLGKHHYYDLSTGVADSKLGRAIMAGIAHNPVLETLRQNGYHIQYVHGMDYFVHERGTLDFVYPEEPSWSVLRIFSSPVLNAALGASNVATGKRPLAEQAQVLSTRIEAAARSDVPWFTFSHISLPGHSPVRSDWHDLASFEDQFRDRTVAANAHMLRLMDELIAADPGAVVIIVGDHGAWRYRNAWAGYEVPSDGLAASGIALDTAARDLFGIMVAVRASNGCDQSFYPGVTPVNLLRVLFACLSGDLDLMHDRPADVSIFESPGPKWRDKALWAVAREGQALSSWEPLERP